MARAPARRRLTPGAILTAAVEVLEEDGVDAFAMRAVAARLGTGAASLYRHVASREELLDLVVEDAIRSVPVPDGALPWRERLTVLARDLRGVLTSRRDLARVAMTSSTVTPNSMRIAESVLGSLSDAGCSPALASVLLDRLSLYVTADAFENSLYLARMSRQENEEHWDAVAATYGALDPAEYPQLTAHAGSLATATPQQRFEVGLATLLDGIESALGREGTASRA